MPMTMPMTSSDPAEVDALLAEAVPSSPEGEVALYEEEAASPGEPDPRRNARLLYEMACLRERRLHNAREAGRLYTQSLTADPTLQPNTWALHRLFSARGAWENLLRLLEAELRFAPLPTTSDRADVLVEKGRLLEDRLGRPEDGRLAYRAALQAHPGHPAALLCLLLAGLESRSASDVVEALGGLARLAEEPRLRALFFIELGRVERGSFAAGADPEGVKRAADTLFRSLQEGAAEEPIGEELDRLSLASGDGALRSRVLDLFDSWLARDEGVQAGRGGQVTPAFLVALHREKARVLGKRGAREAALAVLERGLAMVPAHPLLVADLLDVAEELGHADAISRLVESGAVGRGSYRHHEALLRQAEVFSRVGALGEAIGSLEQIPAASRLAPLAWLCRARVLARLGDDEALARLLVEQAERLLVGPTEGEPTGEQKEGQKEIDAGEDGARPERAEAAHLLTRAAVIRSQRGGADDLLAAEELLDRALGLRPGYAPAREVLREILGRRGRFAELAALYETEAAAASGQSARDLKLSLHLLYRDLLRDGEAVRRLESELPESTSEIEALVRGADEAGERFVREGEGAEEAIRQLRTLSDRAGEGAVSAGLRLLAADVAARAGAERAALALGEEALRCDPRSPAAAELEQRHRAAGRSDEALKVLLLELEAHQATGPESGSQGSQGSEERDVAEALRYRAALCALEADKGAEALALLAPLRAQGDEVAILLSLDMVQQTAAATLEAALLAEPAVIEALGRRSSAGEAHSLLSRAEALETAGDSPAAAESYRAALDATITPEHDGLRARAALGLYRMEAGAAAQGPQPEATGQALAAFARLGYALRDTPGGEPLVREARLLALAAGGHDGAGAHANADGRIDGQDGQDGQEDAVAAIERWIVGLRAGDSEARAEGLASLATLARAPGAASCELEAVLGVRDLLAGQPGAVDRLVGAVTGGLVGGPTLRLVEVAVSDLPARRPLPPPLFDLRRARAERLAAQARGQSGTAAMAETLFTEEALEQEAAGRLPAAAAAQVRALALGSDLEATEALRRLANATGRRRAEAAALVRLGQLLADPSRAAERFAEAGLLFEEESLPEDAAAAFLEVLRRVPEDDEAFRRLAALVERRGQIEALEGLYSFKLGRTEEPAARVALYAQRAALRAGALGRRREAIHDHRRILELAPQRKESLVFLAQRALEADRFSVAIPFYERALDVAPDAADATGLRLELARAYERAHRPAEALAVLRAAVDAHPEDPVPRERVIALASRRRDHDVVAGELQALRALNESPAAKAALSVRLGRLERDERQDRSRAMAAFRTALELDPLGGAAREMLATVGSGPLAPEDAAAANQVIARLRAALAEDPLSPRHLECLRDLAALRGLHDLRDVAAQLETALGTGAFRGRARELARAVPLTSLGALGTPADPPGIAPLSEMWPHLAEGVARLFPGAAAELGVNRQSRVAPGAEPRLGWAEAASVAIGLPSLTIHVGGLDELTVAAFDLPETSLAVGRGILGGDPISRFRVGRALALLRLRATALERMSDEDVELVWAAAAHLAAERPAPGFELATVKATAKRLAKGLSRREVKSLETYADAIHGQRLDPLGWRDAVLRTANRFGLVAGGDLTSALRAIADSGQLREEHLRSPACRDLIEFALGDRYAAVRRDAGLSRD